MLSKVIQQVHQYILFIVFCFQFCDVSNVAIIHKPILAKSDY
jgi:hypothetical protein